MDASIPTLSSKEGTNNFTERAKPGHSIQLKGKMKKGGGRELADRSEFLIAFLWMAETRFLNKQTHGTKPTAAGGGQQLLF